MAGQSGASNQGTGKAASAANTVGQNTQGGKNAVQGTSKAKNVGSGTGSSAANTVGANTGGGENAAAGKSAAEATLVLLI